jgi:hypothetical protein
MGTVNAMQGCCFFDGSDVLKGILRLPEHSYMAVTSRVP